MPAIKLSQNATEHLMPILGRFQAATSHGAYVVRIPVKEDRLPVPWLAYLVLVQIVGSVDLGRHDRVLWHVPFRYDGVEAMLAHEKVGVRLYLGSDDRNLGALGDEIGKKLAAVVRVLESDVLKDLADRRYSQGRVTVMNQAHRLRHAYEYFRDQAETTLAASGAPDTQELGEPGEPGWLTRGIDRRYLRLQTGSFNGLAAINAYFSWIEHVLVLALAFTDEDAGDDMLRKHIGGSWGAKFHRIFKSDSEASSIYRSLREVAESYRNPYAHGGFDKRGATIGVQIVGIGCVPARLTNARQAPQFDLAPFTPERFSSVAMTFDKVDRFLREGPHRLAVRYVERGLDVPFDKRSRRKLRNAMADEQRFAAFLERRTDDNDTYLNMDF